MAKRDLQLPKNKTPGLTAKALTNSDEVPTSGRTVDNTNATPLTIAERKNGGFYGAEEWKGKVGKGEKRNGRWVGKANWNDDPRVRPFDYEDNLQKNRVIKKKKTK